ncbi:MAG: hypothetical protein H3Z54_06380 [archaeon]|nr:hypothetical protein [archaeon]MCP8317179.1 hypothetical protein [archaeon]
MEAIVNRKVLSIFAVAMFLMSMVVVAVPVVAYKGGVPAPGENHNVAELGAAPAEWGKHIEGSSGWVKYFKTGDGFKGVIQVRGLEPNHEYTLCINGKPDMPGTPSEYYAAGIIFYDYDAPTHTNWGTTPGGAWGAEEFCDFWLIITDDEGNYGGDFYKVLPPGTYDVKFFVKDAHAWCIYDTTGTWKTIVLYNDYVSFIIE